MKSMHKPFSFCKQITGGPAFWGVFISSVLVILSPATTNGQGNLMITPRRVVFEGQRKTQELNLANSGKDTARYVISMIEIRMKEDGTFEQITTADSGQYFASAFIRFFPRSVTLGPGEVQSVKIQITKQNQLTAGEYRSHIYFRAIPQKSPLGENAPVQDTTGISISITPVFGISIPVIIRTNSAPATVDLSHTAFEMVHDTVPVLSMVFKRAGGQSVYGDVTIDFVSQKGKATRVGEIKGMAVYTPTPSRSIRITLDKTRGIIYKNGKLHISYKTSSDVKPVQMAEAELVLL